MAELQQIDASDLPPRLAELASVIGLPATLRLVEARGGTRIYVPDTVTSDSWLARLIGLIPFEALVKHYRREFLVLDRAAAALRAVRDRRIIADHAEGASTASLALECGLTQRQVFNILAQGDKASTSQPDLFQRASD